MKTFKQFLTESKQLKEDSVKYKEGEFGYWWTIIKGNSDIEGKDYKGDIEFHYEDITSLKGCPKKVSGSFDCASNRLTSLKGCPKEIKGDFDCSHNHLTTLDGGPKKVGGYFWCLFNDLKSLKGGPESVDGDFDCSRNQLTSLKYAPKKVKGNFDCQQNENLVSVEDIGYVGKNLIAYFVGNIESIENLREKVKGVIRGIKVDSIKRRRLKYQPEDSEVKVGDEIVFEYLIRNPSKGIKYNDHVKFTVLENRIEIDSESFYMSWTFKGKLSKAIKDYERVVEEKGFTIINSILYWK